MIRRWSGPLQRLSEAPQFDPEFLASLGRDLATHLGPIAATLVRRAAGSARDRDSLCRSLAEHLDEPEQRYAFLRRNSPGEHAALPVTQARAPSAAVHAQAALSAEAMAAAQAVLVAEMGPIATLIVRKAAALKLPRFLEPHRVEIEAALPALA
jgi:hypothetical protein